MTRESLRTRSKRGSERWRIRSVRVVRTQTIIRGGQDQEDCAEDFEVVEGVSAKIKRSINRTEELRSSLWMICLGKEVGGKPAEERIGKRSDGRM